MVVVAIIAILAAMLLPALNSAREKAKESNCRGKIKQLGSAMFLYSTDYDGYVMHCDPNTGDGVASYGGSAYDARGIQFWNTTYKNRFWPSMVLQYLNNVGLLLCDSAQPFPDETVANFNAYGRLSYVFNGKLTSEISGDTLIRTTTKIDQVKNPSGKVAFSEYNRYYHRRSYLLPYRNGSPGAPSGLNNNINIMHGSGSRGNNAMCDGSVMTFPLTVLYNNFNKFFVPTLP